MITKVISYQFNIMSKDIKTDDVDKALESHKTFETLVESSQGTNISSSDSIIKLLNILKTNNSFNNLFKRIEYDLCKEIDNSSDNKEILDQIKQRFTKKKKNYQ